MRYLRDDLGAVPLPPNLTRTLAPPPFPPVPPIPGPPEAPKTNWLALLAYLGFGFAAALATVLLFLLSCWATRFLAWRLFGRPGAFEEQEGEEGEVPGRRRHVWGAGPRPPSPLSLKMETREAVWVHNPGQEEAGIVCLGLLEEEVEKAGGSKEGGVAGAAAAEKGTAHGKDPTPAGQPEPPSCSSRSTTSTTPSASSPSTSSRANLSGESATAATADRFSRGSERQGASSRSSSNSSIGPGHDRGQQLQLAEVAVGLTGPDVR